VHTHAYPKFLSALFAPCQFLFSGRFQDFVPSWFDHVGAAILFTMLLNTINPHIFPLIQLSLDRTRRRREAKHCATQQ